MKDLKIAISLFVCSAGISFTNHFWKWAGKMLLFFMFKVSWGRTPWKASDYDYTITVSITAVVSLIKNLKNAVAPPGFTVSVLPLCCLLRVYQRGEFCHKLQPCVATSLTFIFTCCVWKLFIEKNNSNLGCILQYESTKNYVSFMGFMHFL